MITVGKEIFKTQKALQDRVRAILWAYKPETVLSDEHREFIFELLKRHPRVEEKIGAGIQLIRVVKNFYGSQGFEILRVDGSVDDFSYKECIKPSSLEAQFKAACRLAIDDQILACKDAFWKERASVKCPFTGEEITRTRCVVDHAPPKTFEWIITSFIQIFQVKVEEVVLIKLPRTLDSLPEGELKRAWQEFHRVNANLRVVSALANSSHIRRGLLPL
jgi:hypothetical protein